jgi:hypothetical protein
MLALELPKWVIKAIDRRRRGFLWAGKESTNGGKCLVAWDKVARPLQYGGLCISNLQMMSLSLRVRWLWLEKIDAPRPWAALPLPVSNKEKAFFHMAVETVVGNGENTLFWKDCWLGGQSIQELGPNLSMLISTRVSKRRTVAQGLVARWVRDIRGALTVPVIIEFLKLWEILDEFGLQPGVDDQHKWRLEQDGSYSSRSAYKACFQGSIRFVPWKLAWKTWAPPKCSFFMWLVFKNRCWTADRLKKRGLPHPLACPLCDQEAETIQYLLLSCVFARQVWAAVFQKLGLPSLVPRPTDDCFLSWWSRSKRQISKNSRKGLNTVITLVA